MDHIIHWQDITSNELCSSKIYLCFVDDKVLLGLSSAFCHVLVMDGALLYVCSGASPSRLQLTQRLKHSQRTGIGRSQLRKAAGDCQDHRSGI